MRNINTREYLQTFKFVKLASYIIAFLLATSALPAASAEPEPNISVEWLPVMAGAYHMTLLYDDGRGGYQYFIGGGTIFHLITSESSLSAEQAANANRPDVFGVLVARSGDYRPGTNLSPAELAQGGWDPGSVINIDGSQILNGQTTAPWEHETISYGPEATAQWQAILATGPKISGLDLTYAPLSQNSNSIVFTALHTAGLPTPHTHWAPGGQTLLPLSKAEIPDFLRRGRQ